MKVNENKELVLTVKDECDLFKLAYDKYYNHFKRFLRRGYELNYNVIKLNEVVDECIKNNHLMTEEQFHSCCHIASSKNGLVY